MFDIVIIGSGPAGANLARLIGNKYKVLLIDKRSLDNGVSVKNSMKCCGGLLSPDAQKMIAKLNLGLPKNILVNPQLFAVRTIDLTNKVERLYQRFYLNMDRDKFDKWLVSLIPVNVEKRFNSYLHSINKIQGGYEVKYYYDGVIKSVNTKIIVGADGAQSRVRKYIDIERTNPQKYISIQEWYKCSHPMPYYTAVFDEEISDFYSWIIPKENYQLLGSALKPQDNTRERYELLKSKLIKYGFDFENKLKVEGSFINRPKKPSQLYIGKDRIALVGEAAGAISPSSAEGISYALKTSLYLADSLEDGMESFFDSYKHKMHNIKVNLLLKNLKSPAMYNPLIRNMAMKSGFLCIK